MGQSRSHPTIQSFSLGSMGRFRLGVATGALLLLTMLLVQSVEEGYGSSGGSRRDYYEVLGVARDADVKEIKRAYHRLALELHPDKQEGEDEEAVKAFIEVVTAYEVLSDPDKRRRYDMLGSDYASSSARGGARTRTKSYDSEPFDLKAQFFGGAFEFSFTRKPSKRAQNILVQVPLTLEEMYKGKNISQIVSRERLCPHCHGNRASDPKHIHTCSLCNGSGRAYALFEHQDADPNCGGSHHQHYNHDDDDTDYDDDDDDHRDEEDCDETVQFRQVTKAKCPICGGTGEVVDEGGQCNFCGGTGLTVSPKTFNVELDPGILPGKRITFKGEGNQAVNSTDGDVVFQIRVLDHPRFRIRGARGDLEYSAKISLVDALVGFNRTVKHLDGRKVPVVHDVVTFEGFEQKVIGEGLPRAGIQPQKSHGDLYVMFEVEFPSSLTARQREALRTVMDEDDISIIDAAIQLRKEVQDARDFEVERLHATFCAKSPDICPLDSVGELLQQINK